MLHGPVLQPIPSHNTAAAGAVPYKLADQASQMLMQIWRQGWAWTEAGMPHDIAARNSQAGIEIAKEPMFCFEAAAKCLLWSELVYKPDEPQVM